MAECSRVNDDGRNQSGAGRTVVGGWGSFSTSSTGSHIITSSAQETCISCPVSVVVKAELTLICSYTHTRKCTNTHTACFPPPPDARRTRQLAQAASTGTRSMAQPRDKWHGPILPFVGRGFVRGFLRHGTKKMILNYDEAALFFCCCDFPR